MKVGEHIKVVLPGETPWAIVTAILSDEKVMARIDNHPVCDEMHGYKYGDVATFMLEKGDDWQAWQLAPLDDQAPVGPRGAD